MPYYVGNTKRWKGKNKKRPWEARAGRKGVRIHLGWYETLEEAYAAEMAFAKEFPPSASGASPNRRKNIPNDLR